MKKVEKNQVNVFIASDREVENGYVDVEIPKVKRWLALDRADYWNNPTFGVSDFSGIKNQTQFLLVELENGEFEAFLPMVDQANYASFVYRDGNLKLDFKGTLKGHAFTDTMVLASLRGTDPSEVVEELVATVARVTGSFKLRNEKARPEFVKYIGWCTWDAFYQSVDFEKVKVGLESFKQKGIKLGFMILDDGGLDTTEDYLNSFSAYSGKFPGGFTALSKMAKEEYGLKMFGLWHAFEGYWTGINPESRLAEKYGIVENSNVIRPWIKPLKYERLCLVDPKNVGDFFDDFYESLSLEGIDLLKVDGQSALELFTEGKLGRSDTMKSFQNAMQNAAKKHFGNSHIISCMCNGTDVMFNMFDGNVWRNSQDYFPGKPAEVQAYHVYANAYNSILSSTFSWPDWDMFQTHTPEADYHVAARAISGGPIYVCDKPGEQVAEKIDKLCFSDGSVPLFDRPALPSKDVLMVDCYNQPELLKVTNIKGEIGQIVAFNCYKSGGKVCGKIKPSDIKELKPWKYAVYELQKGKVYQLEFSQEMHVELDTMEAGAFVVSPIKRGIAMLGLVDKVAAAATFEVIDENTFYIFDRGTVLLFATTEPRAIKLDGSEIPFKFDRGTDLISVQIEKPGIISIETGD